MELKARATYATKLDEASKKKKGGSAWGEGGDGKS
jgi:hypothetical protein